MPNAKWTLVLTFKSFSAGCQAQIKAYLLYDPEMGTVSCQSFKLYLLTAEMNVGFITFSGVFLVNYKTNDAYFNKTSQ